VKRISEWSEREWGWAAAALAVAVYLPALVNGFAYDDLPIIEQNQMLRSFSQLGELLTSPYWPGERGPDFGLWRPTTSLVMAVVWQLSGGAALAFHLANVALHAGVTFLVVRVLGVLLPVTAAGLAGVAFAIHPVHVEAVANGVGIAELLAAALLLLALDLTVREDRVGPRETLSVLALYALAFGAKESAVVLPGLVVVLDGMRRGLRPADLPGYLRDRGLLIGGLAGVAAAMLAARYAVLGGVASALPALGADILVEIPRIWTLGEIWFQTLRLVSVPTWLSPDYAPEVIPILTVWTPKGVAGAVGVLAALGAALLCARRLGASERAPARATDAAAASVVLGVLWFVVAISPTSNVLFVTGVLLAERTLYLPSIGVAAIFGGLLAPLLLPEVRADGEGPASTRRAVALVLTLLLAGAWTVRTVTYIPAWRSHTSIFQHMVEVVPNSGRAQWVVGDVRVGEGDVEQGLYHYRVALGALGPEYAFLTETARRLISLQRADAAEPFLERAWDARPDVSGAASLMAVAAAQAQDWPRVATWARRAVEIEPDDLTAWHLLSTALAEAGEWAEAQGARETLIARDPASPWQQWFWLIELRARAGDPAGAREAADSARARTAAPAALAQIDSLLAALAGPPGADSAASR
jgi:tetratricopeptide (TPR) repeat protein